MSASAKTIPDDVLAVLSAGRCEGPRYYLTTGQLARPMYEAVNKVLAALGGKWNRSAKAHVFTEDCESLVDGAIESGTYTRPSDMGWFPTPASLAADVVAMARIEPGMIVLEPSAGEGSIAREIRAAGGLLACVEIDPKRAAVLAAEFGTSNVYVGDFLQLPPVAVYDRVVMNPPFAKRADIHHALHARDHLREGGVLVAIMSAGVAFRQDALAADFRAQCDSIEHLPGGAFKESGTGVRTVVVTMRAAA